MKRVVRTRTGSWRGIVVAAAIVSAAGSARAASEGSNWTLSLDKTHRTCELMLHFDAAGAAGELALPAGCRRALPAVREAVAWSIGDGSQIRFSDASGQTLLTFDRQPDGGWHAVDRVGRGLRLVPVATDTAMNASGDLVTGAGPVALALPPVDTPAQDGPIVQIATAAGATKPATAASAKDIAGRYAVLRGDRDTGCMVTLDADTRGPKGGFRARLAPACRDQGIIIFDPLGWQPKGAELVLTARKGHSISLEKDENGVWTKTPKDVKALGLKHL